MTDTITVRGNVGNDPDLRTSRSGVPVASFRLAVTKRQLGDDGTWTDGETYWYSVSCWRRLGEHVSQSISKGDPVVVIGKPRINSWENTDGHKFAEIEINADAVGHDLKLGTSRFTRMPVGSPAPQAPPVAGSEAGTDQHAQAQENTDEHQNSGAEPALAAAGAPAEGGDWDTTRAQEPPF